MCLTFCPLRVRGGAQLNVLLSRWVPGDLDGSRHLSQWRPCTQNVCILSRASPCTPLVPQVHEKLGSQLANLDPALQVDMLWALCVLQQAQASELQAVLRPGLHTQFLGEGGGLCAALGLRYPAYVPKARCGWEPLGPGPGETMGQGSPAFAALPPASR